MLVPDETEAGSAGTQPCRGIVWWAHRDDAGGRGSSLSRSSRNHIGSKDPDALKIPARRAEYSLAESALSPFQAEPTQGWKQMRRSPCADSSGRLAFRKRPCGFVVIPLSEVALVLSSRAAGPLPIHLSHGWYVVRRATSVTTHLRRPLDRVESSASSPQKISLGTEPRWVQQSARKKMPAPSVIR